MYTYKTVQTQHLDRRKYHYYYNPSTDKWVRITSYDFTARVLLRPHTSEQVSESEVIYTVTDKLIYQPTAEPTAELTDTLTRKPTAEPTAEPTIYLTDADEQIDFVTPFNPRPRIQYELPFAEYEVSDLGRHLHTTIQETAPESKTPITMIHSDNPLSVTYENFKLDECKQRLAGEYAYWLLPQLDPSLNLRHDIRQISLSHQRVPPYGLNAILVKLYKPIADLTLEYFQANNLLYDTLALIEYIYTSRDGYISPCPATPPTLEAIFINPFYVKCALEIFTYHKLGINYRNDSPPYYRSKWIIDKTFAYRAKLEYTIYNAVRASMCPPPYA